MKTGETVWLADGRTLVLGALIKSGGAGSVYLLPGSPAQVAKLCHPQLDRVANRKKLAAMLALSPELPDQLENGKRYVQIAWPSLRRPCWSRSTVARHRAARARLPFP